MPGIAEQIKYMSTNLKSYQFFVSKNTNPFK